MSVRQSLLALLDQGPCYGNQLRAEFDRRTGAIWPLNVGQIYNTLDRLERDGLVIKGEADASGHVYYEITEEGRAEAGRWLSSAVAPSRSTRDELAIKIALAATLPGADVHALIERQRAAAVENLQSLREAVSEQTTSAEGLARSLIVDALVFDVQAEILWLDHTRDLLTQHPMHSFALEISREQPRRGRPARVDATAGMNDDAERER